MPHPLNPTAVSSLRMQGTAVFTDAWGDNLVAWNDDVQMAATNGEVEIISRYLDASGGSTTQTLWDPATSPVGTLGSVILQALTAAVTIEVTVTGPVVPTFTLTPGQLPLVLEGSNIILLRATLASGTATVKGVVTA